MQSILLIHRPESTLQSAYRWLSRSGFDVHGCQDFDDATQQFNIAEFDLVLLDLTNMNYQPDAQAFIHCPCPIVIFETDASIDNSARYMSLGAAYYLSLPITADQLLANLIQVFEIRQQKSFYPTPHTNQTSSVIEQKIIENGIIGNCLPMQALFSDIEKVAGTDVTVLIRGESGTGKELVAKALHNLSKRKNHPLISVNCAAIPENLIESELFGHEKGAFTGAVSARDGLIYAADNGTLFLDEIGELPLEAQARLLRVLQEGEIRRVGAVQATKVNIRLITATHRNLRDMVSQGQFREDLYYRLYVMELIVPPLRDRGSDISLIAQILLQKACDKHHKPKLTYTEAFDRAIRAHDWPGNVRELENAIERATILSGSHCIDPDNLKLPAFKMHTQSTPLTSTPDTPTTGTSLDDYLKHFVLINQHKMSETQLALSLGISRKSLWERRQKLGIPKKVTSDR